MADSFFIKMNTSRIHIHVFGSGPRLLIAFHGFKESGIHFSSFENILGGSYTIYAPDLPYSGSTLWKDHFFLVDDLQSLMHALLDHFGEKRFALLGYSMGGRVALSAASFFFRQMDAMVLLASDGLKVNPWYYFVTQTTIGHGLFHYFTYHPGMLKFIVEAGFKLHLTNESVYKFVKMYTSEKKQRELVYKVWTCMKDLYPNMTALKEKIKDCGLPVILFFGKYDRIFPPRNSKIFDDVPSAQILALDCGHQMIRPDVGEEIFRYLSQNNTSS